MKEDVFKDFKQSIENVKLVAVSKTKPKSAIETLYNYGQRVFGENRTQELIEKANSLPQDIEWHFIGHLQSKKVKSIAPFAHTIHSIDSQKLLLEVNKQAKKAERTINCLLQFHIAKEQTKYGFNLNEVEELLEEGILSKLDHVKITGVMGMATFTEDQDQIRQEFKSLKSIFDTLKGNYFNSDKGFKEISMGMSGDYLLAIEEGSTMVRIGSLLFGARN